MSEDGTRTHCSDAVDFSGRYIWREDGKEQGRCCGIDFEQAGKNWRANKCGKADPVCRSAAISTYVPYAYDAGIALAHGLHKLLHHDGISRQKITADLLIQAIRNSSFRGVSGGVSFLSNGDRRPNDFAYFVYNYQYMDNSTAHGFKAVGKIRNDGFSEVCEDGPCASIMYSDGRMTPPDSEVRDTKAAVAYHA